MKFYKKLPPFILFCARAFILQFILFSVLRIVFYLFAVPESSANTAFVAKLMAFRMGFEFDMIIVCYALYLPFTLLFIASFFKQTTTFLDKTALLFLQIVFVAYNFVCIANIPYFQQFGSHLSKQAFLWSSDPGFMLGLIFGNFSYWGYLLLFAALLLPFFPLLKRIIKKYKEEKAQQKKMHWGLNALAGILCLGFIIIGSRGRITKTTPTHEGLAVVCDDGFINQLALNPNYTLLKSVFYYKTKKYTAPAEIDEYIAYTRKYLDIQSPYTRSISREIKFSGPAKKTNVVVVLMESMSVYKMGYYGGKNLTPCFDSIIRESVFFNKFFSSGIHTFNGLFSTSSGYPAVLTEKSLLHYTRQPFNSVAGMLRQDKYATYYFTSQDPYFDNMAGFFRINNFTTIIGQYDFPSEQALSTLGVPDHVLFKRFIDTMNERKDDSPFFSLIMTSSDHGPWKIPQDIPFKPNSGDEKDDCTMYADWSLGQFIKEAKKQKWYDNTVFLFLGDHGLSKSHTYEMPLSYNHIPFVIHQPSVLHADTISHIGYQPDVTATIMALLNRTYVDETFGIDILHRGHPFVMFSADDKIGAVNKQGDYFYYLIPSNVKRLRRYENLDPKDFYPTKRPTADSLDYGTKAILETARYFVQKKYYNY